MKKYFSLFILTSVAFFLDAQEEQRTFDNIKRVNSKFVWGNLSLEKSGDTKTIVLAQSSFQPGVFHPSIKQTTSELTLEENFKTNELNGEANWKVQVPEGVRVIHSSAAGGVMIEDGLHVSMNVSMASGGMNANNCKGEWKLRTVFGSLSLRNHAGNIDLSTASGDITLVGCNGNAQIRSTSGNIAMNNCEGELVVGVASGTIKMDGCKLTGISKFSSASGSVKVNLSGALRGNLMLSTSSGSLTLDLNGQPVNATLIIKTEKNIKTKKEDTRLSCPFSFDSVNEAREKNDDQNIVTVTRTIKLGNGEKQITLSSSSGKIKIEK